MTELWYNAWQVYAAITDDEVLLLKINSKVTKKFRIF